LHSIDTKYRSYQAQPFIARERPVSLSLSLSLEQDPWRLSRDRSLTFIYLPADDLFSHTQDDHLPIGRVRPPGGSRLGLSDYFFGVYYYHHYQTNTTTQEYK
jgi:hypothetical protein